ncbi:hypothetical protein INR49_021747 [Caranx melampygus]|nr:hypothetical protein INR49_021747 [Caranx melampygus]
MTHPYINEKCQDCRLGESEDIWGHVLVEELLLLCFNWDPDLTVSDNDVQFKKKEKKKKKKTPPTPV